MSERKHFRTGEAFSSIEEFEAAMRCGDHAVQISEDQRQLVLLALAELSIARPGWLWTLEQIALKMDNNVEGQAEMFEQLRRNHSDPVAERLANS